MPFFPPFSAGLKLMRLGALKTISFAFVFSHFKSVSIIRFYVVVFCGHFAGLEGSLKLGIVENPGRILTFFMAWLSLT